MPTDPSVNGYLPTLLPTDKSTSTVSPTMGLPEQESWWSVNGFSTTFLPTDKSTSTVSPTMAPTEQEFLLWDTLVPDPDQFVSSVPLTNQPAPTRFPITTPTTDRSTTTDPATHQTGLLTVSPQPRFSANPSQIPSISGRGCPGPMFKVAITTDNFPFGTSWDLVNMCNGIVEAEGGDYGSASTLHEHEYCVPAAQYKFTIRHPMWGNFIGRYEVFLDGVSVIEGGEFKYTRWHEVGRCPVEGPTSSPTYTYDCLCAHASMGYVSKPDTNCTSYVQCSGSRMVQELSCPGGMIFDSKMQECYWEGFTNIFKSVPYEVACENPASFEEDTTCKCEYFKTECARGLQDLTAETISTWMIPPECDRADALCLASEGRAMYQDHKADVCTCDIQPACKDGGSQSQSCLDHVTHCCGGASADCQCEDIEAGCELGNAKSCAVFASTCCNDDECECYYMTKSCSASLESALEGALLSNDCLDAEQLCCADCTPIQALQDPSIGSCQCGCKFWDQLCTSSPVPACPFYAGRCCGSSDHGTHNAQCHCEMSDYLSDNLNHELEYKDACSKAKEVEFLTNSTKEMEVLVSIYSELGGTEWHNSTNWLDTKAGHCNWHGVKCEDNYIVEVDLSSNNLVGIMYASRFFSSLNKLVSLNLANNSLGGVIEFNSLYQLRNLKRVDMSENDLNGEVDVLLSPAVQELNLSHNKFTSLIHFKFRGSQRTLERLDMSRNNIRQPASRIFEHIPSSLKELVLIENHVHGSLPNPLPTLVDLVRLSMKSNDMEGQIPDMSRSFQRLQELDLSDQQQANNGGFSRAIPGGWSKISDLVILDLSANKLTGGIPPDIGNLLKLKKLVVSNNLLSGNIPASLGKLTGSCEVLDLSNNALSDIPPEFGDFKKSPDTLIKLIGNPGM